jgi:flagellar hook assembly protein FlgD
VNGVDHTTGGGNETPARATLEQNYPNPFNPSTTITFALPAASHVRLLICDLLGREIRRLVDAPYGGGFHTVRWDATDDNGAKVTSGVYFYRIQAGTYSAVRRMLLVR